MKIGILGGAFDPPTKGHIQLAKFVQKQMNFVFVLLMPCYRHIFRKKMSLDKNRFEMCKLAIGKSNVLFASPFEIKNKLTGRTYDVIKKLGISFDLYFIIGLDEAEVFDQWYKFKELKRIAKFIVVSRKGIKRNKSINWYLKAPHIFLKSNKIMQVSSTCVRNLIALNKDKEIEKMIDRSVYQYIKMNNLYNRNYEK